MNYSIVSNTHLFYRSKKTQKLPEAKTPTADRHTFLTKQEKNIQMVEELVKQAENTLQKIRKENKKYIAQIPKKKENLCDLYKEPALTVTEYVQENEETIQTYSTKDNPNEVVTIYKSAEQEKEKFLYLSESTISRELNMISESTETDSSKDAKALDDGTNETDTFLPAVILGNPSTSEPHICKCKSGTDMAQFGDNMQELYHDIYEESNVEYVDTIGTFPSTGTQKLDAIPEISETDMDRNQIPVNKTNATQNTELAFEIRSDNIGDNIRDIMFNSEKHQLDSVQLVDAGVQITLKSSTASLSDNDVKPFGYSMECKCNRKLAVQKLLPVSIRNTLVLQKLTNVDIPGESRPHKSTERCNACYIEIKADLEGREASANQEHRVNFQGTDVIVQGKRVSELSTQTDNVHSETKETQYIANKDAAVNTTKSQKSTGSSNAGNDDSRDSKHRQVVFTSYQVVPDKSHDPDITLFDKKLMKARIDDLVSRAHLESSKGSASLPQCNSSEKVICLLPEREELRSTRNSLIDIPNDDTNSDLEADKEMLRRHEMYNMHTMGFEIARNLGQDFVGIPITAKPSSGANNLREFDQVISVLNEVIKNTGNTSDSENDSTKKTTTATKEEITPFSDNVIINQQSSANDQENDPKCCEINRIQENVQNIQKENSISQEDTPGKVKFIEIAHHITTASDDSTSKSSVASMSKIDKEKLEDAEADLKYNDNDNKTKPQASDVKDIQDTASIMLDKGMQTSSTESSSSDDDVESSGSGSSSNYSYNEQLQPDTQGRFFERITSDDHKLAMATKMEQKLTESAAGSVTSDDRNDVAAVLRQEIKEMALKQQESIQQYFVPSPEAIERIQRRSVYFSKKKKGEQKAEQDSSARTNENKIEETEEEDSSGKKNETTAMAITIIQNNPLLNKGQPSCSKDSAVALCERNTPAGDSFDYRDYLRVHPNGRYEDEAHYFCQLCHSQRDDNPPNGRKLNAPQLHTDTSDASSETLSEGEVRCKCNVSIGEIHVCRYPKNIRASVEYFKRNPEQLIRNELRDPDLRIQKQRMYYSNWVAYYVSK